MKLDSIIKSAAQAEKTADLIVVHGNAGTGKTSLFAHAEKPLFLPAHGEEDGIAKLAQNNLVPDDVKWLPEIKLSNKQEHDGWNALKGTLRLLAQEEHEYKNIILDCFDDEGFLSFAYQAHADEMYDGDMGPGGFMSFQQGYNTVIPTIKEVTHGCIQPLLNKGINVILLAHSTVGTYKNPAGADYTRYVPLINQKSVWPLIQARASMVLFLDTPTTVVKKENEAKGKGKGGSRRVLYAESRATHEAKNRHGLPAQIQLPEDHTQAYAALKQQLEGGKEE